MGVDKRFCAWQDGGCPMKTGDLSESGRILTSLGLVIIVQGNPEGAISGKVGLIWGIPG